MDSLWKHLEQDITNWLSSYSSDSVEFRNSYQAIVGFPSDGPRSDGMLSGKNTLIAVEIEAGQTHPDTNVGKYWLLHAKYKQYKKYILFHIYTPDFNSYGWRKKLGEFYACKMRLEVPMDYVVLDYRKAKNYDTTLTEIKTLIQKRIWQEFRQ